MPLPAGTRFGSYEIVESIGAGGMGEVYRARDAKLDRDVALKILPAAWADDADRIARLAREAKILASLNHPNVAHIYGFEDGGPTPALVMELVEGPTLADRLARGAIPLADARPIARQIAEALEAAHDAGMVHRDLKPANVKVRDDGVVKVLDFGLAKALTAVTDSSPAAMTVTSPAATEQGIVLGTAAYMSPEQAKGRPVDKRADIWALGVVLFEMLCGERPFGGDTIAETMAAVIKDAPKFERLPRETPVAVRQLLARCLDRDPRLRLRDAGEARIVLASTDEPDVAVTADPPPHASTPARGRAGLFLTAAAAIVVAAAAGWWWGARRATAPPGDAPLHAEIVPTPANALSGRATLPLFTFTADGRAIIYASNNPRSRLLYRRALDSSTAVPIAGTDGAAGPFVSPDGAWIGFFADGSLKRIPMAGGAAEVIHDLKSPTAPDAMAVGWSSELGAASQVAYGATWLPDDTIVYGRFAGGLWQVPAHGGTPKQVSRALGADGEVANRLPHALPGGQAVLFTVVRDVGAELGSTVEALNLTTGVRTKILDNATDAEYAPGGYLLFARTASLYAVRFDPSSLRTAGDPVLVVDDVMHAVGGGFPGVASGAAQYDVSIDGTLAVLGGGLPQQPPNQLGWMSHGGTAAVIPTEPARFLGPRLSPDGSHVAVWTGTDLAVVDTRTAISTPVLKDGLFPVWMPDGKRLLAAIRTKGKQDIYSVPLVGGGSPQLVVTGPNLLWPSSVSHDGKWLAYVETNPVTGNDIWVAGLDPKTAPTAVVNTAANETHPVFSPDGKWLAYVVEENGSREIYVRPFPGPGQAERITRDGGNLPEWAPDGRAVFYVASGRQIVRAAIDTSGGRVTLGPSDLFAHADFSYSTPVGGFNVSPDGSRLLGSMSIRPPPDAVPTVPILATLQIIVHALPGAVR